MYTLEFLKSPLDSESIVRKSIQQHDTWTNPKTKHFEVNREMYGGKRHFMAHEVTVAFEFSSPIDRR